MPYSSWILPGEQIPLAGDHVKLVVGQLAPLLFRLALDLLPVAFMRSPIHLRLLIKMNTWLARVSGPVLCSSSQAACQAHFPSGFNGLQNSGGIVFL
jgi:hypothetical protein